MSGTKYLSRGRPSKSGGGRVDISSEEVTVDVCIPEESLYMRLGIVEKSWSVPIALINCKNAVSPSCMITESKRENRLEDFGNTSRNRVTVFPPIVI